MSGLRLEVEMSSVFLKMASSLVCLDAGAAPCLSGVI